MKYLQLIIISILIFSCKEPGEQIKEAALSQKDETMSSALNEFIPITCTATKDFKGLKEGETVKVLSASSDFYYVKGSNVSIHIKKDLLNCK